MSPDSFDWEERNNRCYSEKVQKQNNWHKHGKGAL